jgi:molybdate transport system regulatory protein
VGETIIRLYRDVEVVAQRSCAKQIAELTRLIRS